MAPKGGGGIGRGIQDEQWEGRFDISGTQLERFPDSTGTTTNTLKAVGFIGTQLRNVATGAGGSDVHSLPSQDDRSQQCLRTCPGIMIALQEELDWHCYQLYGLMSDDLATPAMIFLNSLLVSGLLRSLWPGNCKGRTRNHMVRAAWLHADHRDSNPLAGRLSQAGRTSHQADRDEQRNCPHRKAGIQATLE